MAAQFTLTFLERKEPLLSYDREDIHYFFYAVMEMKVDCFESFQFIETFENSNSLCLAKEVEKE